MRSSYISAWQESITTVCRVYKCAFISSSVSPPCNTTGPVACPGFVRESAAVRWRTGRLAGVGAELRLEGAGGGGGRGGGAGGGSGTF